MLSATMNRVPASKWDKRHGTTLHASMELPSAAGMTENRSLKMSVEMLSPSSAAEVCGADVGRYTAGTVLPQGAFYVQSIRATQTADPRAKQTRPSGPARRSARVKIQGLATANWRKWTSRPKVLNGCISALWDDVRRELDEKRYSRSRPAVGFPGK